MKMHRMLIPDRAAVVQGQGKDYPPEWVFAEATQEMYINMYRDFVGYYDSLGKDSKTKPPEARTVPQVKGNAGSFTNYGVTQARLQAAYDTLYESGKAIPPATERTEAVGVKAQTELNKVILMVNESAPTVPPGNAAMKIDEHIWSYVIKAHEAAANAIRTASLANGETAADLDKKTAGMEKQIKDLTDRNKNLEDELKRVSNVPPVYPPSTTLPPGTTPPPVSPDPDLPGLPDLGTDPPDLTDPGTDPTNPGTSTPGGSYPGGTPGSNIPASPVSPANYPSAGAGAGGAGMDMMSQMLPMMMQQAMARQMADQDLNNRREELDPRYRDELNPPAPALAQPAVAAPPASAAPATAPPATTQPPGTSSTQPAGGPPARVPGEDGSVLYTFKDGRTQKVSPIVAQALDAAFGNAKSTNAQAAYAKTPAKWTDNKQIGERVDPYQLMTGDVAVWGGRTALLVVFPAEEGGTLEAIVKGELVQFAQQMSDDDAAVSGVPGAPSTPGALVAPGESGTPGEPGKLGESGKSGEPVSAGDFGEFTGFAHPRGIELTAPTDGGVTPATSAPADQSASAMVPAVAAG
ncbi:hypothetical protein ACFQZZ_24390 [Nocardia sp. GCM10030253]|uniref:hypothetical protein n=1 Tax=Nocardia sp. GCM10030253 TaxID=3273404 RepID=UPI00363E99CC